MQPQLEVHPVGWDAVLEVARHQLTVCVCVFLWGGGLGIATHQVWPGRGGISGACDGLRQVAKLTRVQLGLCQELCVCCSATRATAT